MAAWCQVHREDGFNLFTGVVTFPVEPGQHPKPPVPRGLYEECKLTFLSDVNNCIKQYEIPAELILNADQTPSSYLSVGRMTMAATNSQSVPIKGLTDKRNITLTFVNSFIWRISSTVNYIPG